MCGIVGLCGPQKDGWIEAMNGSQFHRGPDDAGLYRDRDSGMALAMRRLAIIDLAGGHQPMISADGRHVLVFNGEIFNAPALRQDLLAAGVVFATDHSDTEILLHLLVRDGEAALPRLNGMFAFAFYDREAGTLLCARDRIGIKPFYYTQAGGRFAFASEMKSLLRLPWVERRPDRQSLYHYLSLMYVPGEATALDGISRLPAGCRLIFRLKDCAIDVARWWRPDFTPRRNLKARDLPEILAAEIDAAVDRWTLSDVPVGCSLSGGLDSSAIVGFMSRSGHKVRTYSVGFTGQDEEDWNELPLARQVAEHWGTEHHEIVLDPASLLAELPEMVWHMDEPYGGGLPSWMVFKHMKSDVTVAMTGSGGDELFGNYGKWTGLEGRWGGVLGIKGAPHGLERFRNDFAERYYYLADADKRRLTEARGMEGTAEFLYRHYAGAATDNHRDRAAHVDLMTQLPEEFLAMTDRFSMAHSVEARTPFLDAELVGLVQSIPAALRTNRRDLKGLLRRSLASAGIVPADILTAPKKGFVIPLGAWLRGPLRPLCESLLSPGRLAAQGFLKPEFHAAYVQPHLDGIRDFTPKVWAALMLQMWWATFIDGDGAAPLASFKPSVRQ